MSTFVSPRSNSYNPKPAVISFKAPPARGLTPTQVGTNKHSNSRINRDSKEFLVSPNQLKQQLINFKKGLEGIGRNLDTGFKGSLRSYPVQPKSPFERNYSSQKLIGSKIFPDNRSSNLLLQSRPKQGIKILTTPPKNPSSASKLVITEVSQLEESAQKDDKGWKFNISKEQMEQAIMKMETPVKFQIMKLHKDTNTSSADSDDSESSLCSKEFNFNNDIRNIFKIDVPKGSEEKSFSVDETAVSNADENVDINLLNTKSKQFINNLSK